MTPNEALRRASKAYFDGCDRAGINVPLGDDVRDSIARALLLAQAETYEDAHEVRFACGDDGFSEYLARKAAALRAAAEAPDA